MNKKANDIIKAGKARVKSVTVKKTVNSNSSDLSSAEIKLESLKTIKNGMMWATIMVGLVLVLVIVFFVASKTQREVVNGATRYLFFQTQVPVTKVSVMFEKSDVDKVVESFIDAQFMNIKVIPEDDLKKDGRKNGKVTAIHVDGKPINLINNGEFASKASQITIYYHSVKGEKTPERITSGIPALKYIFVIAILSSAFVVLLLLSGINKKKIRENEKSLTMYEG